MQRTRFTRAAATTMAIASLAIAATAGTASASDVGPMIDATGDTAFGNNWQFGAPTLPGTLDWNVAGANTTPVLTGSSYLRNSLGISSRLQLRTTIAFRQPHRHARPARSWPAPTASSSAGSASAT